MTRRVFTAQRGKIGILTILWSACSTQQRGEGESLRFKSTDKNRLIFSSFLILERFFLTDAVETLMGAATKGEGPPGATYLEFQVTDEAFKCTQLVHLCGVKQIKYLMTTTNSHTNIFPPFCVKLTWHQTEWIFGKQEIDYAVRTGPFLSKRADADGMLIFVEGNQFSPSTIAGNS